MVTQERLYTADDLWEISHQPENAGKRFRLIEGVIYEVSPTGWLHGDITSLLDFFLRGHVMSHRLGRLTAAETGFVLHKAEKSNEKDTVQAPDIGFIRAERIPPELPEKFVPFAPDLAVEVLSPSNTPAEMALKVDLYLRYGTRMVWLVYPNEKRIQVYRPTAHTHQASVRLLSIGDSLEGEDVLPGFTLPLEKLFEAPGTSN